MANKIQIPNFLKTGLFGKTADKLVKRKAKIEKAACVASGGSWDEETSVCLPGRK